MSTNTPNITFEQQVAALAMLTTRKSIRSVAGELGVSRRQVKKLSDIVDETEEVNDENVNLHAIASRMSGKTLKEVAADVERPMGWVRSVVGTKTVADAILRYIVNSHEAPTARNAPATDAKVAEAAEVASDVDNECKFEYHVIADEEMISITRIAVNADSAPMSVVTRKGRASFDMVKIAIDASDLPGAFNSLAFPKAVRESW